MVSTLRCTTFTDYLLVGLHTFSAARAIATVRPKNEKQSCRYGWLFTIGLLWLLAITNEARNITSNSDAWLNYDGQLETSFDYFSQGQGSPLNGVIVSSAFFVSVLADGFLVRPIVI